MKIDPKRITLFDRTNSMLEWFLFFCISTAGKNAEVQANKINGMIDHVLASPHGPKGIYGFSDGCADWLVQFSKCFGIGKYTILRESADHIYENNLRHKLDSITLEELLEIPGVGNKTARFFLMHSRPGFTGAVIDTHIHGWLEKVCQSELPKPTTDAKYQSLERLWLSMTEVFFPGLPLHVADLATWILMRTWPQYDPFKKEWDPCVKTAINQAQLV